MKFFLSLFTAAVVVDCVFSIELISRNLREVTTEESDVISDRSLYGNEGYMHYGDYEEEYEPRGGIKSPKSKKKKNGANRSPKSSGKKGSYGMDDEKYEKQSRSGGHNLFKPFTCPGLCATAAEGDVFFTEFGVGLASCDECDPDQRWEINTIKDNYVQIQNVGKGLCLQPVDPTVPGSGCGAALELLPCDLLMGHPTEESLFLRQGSNFISVYCTRIIGFATYIEVDSYEDGGCYEDYIYTNYNDADGEILQDWTWFTEDCPFHPNACPSLWY